MKKEIELKYRFVGIDDFKLFFNLMAEHALSVPITLSQTNYFFDTSSLELYKNNIIVRVRREQDTYFLCIKTGLPGSKSINLFERQEDERSIERKIAQRMIAHGIEPADLPAKLAQPLELVGSFATSRTVFRVELAGATRTLEFDHVTYEDNSEIFELEIELPSAEQSGAVDKAITELLSRAQVAIKPAKGKSSYVFFKKNQPA